MVRSRSPLLIIFVTIFVDMIGFGMIIPLLPIYAKLPQFAAPEWKIGLLAAIYSAVQFIAGPILGRWSDRVGRRPILLCSLLGTAFGFFLMGSAKTLGMLFFARALDGFTGGNISTSQAYIADVLPPEKRAKGMGLIGAAFGLGFVFGPALGGLLSKHALSIGGMLIARESVPFYFAGLLSLLNATAMFFLLPESLPKEKRRAVEKKVSRREAWERVGGPLLAKILGAYFVCIVGFSIMTTAFALFTEHHFGFDQEKNGYLFAGVGIVGAIIQGGLIGRLTKRFGERPLATAGAFLIAVGFFCLPIGHALALLFFANGLVAVGNSLMTPTLNALASQCAGPQSQGSVLGLMASAGSLGRTIGPALAGVLLTLDLKRGEAAYGQTAFWTASALMIVATVLTLFIEVHPQAQSVPAAAG